MSKRYIKNLTNGVIFPYDEVAISDERRRDIIECDIDGNPVVAGSKKEKKAEKKKDVKKEEKKEEDVKAPSFDGI